jgi:hypothetical protein
VENVRRAARLSTTITALDPVHRSAVENVQRNMPKRIFLHPLRLSSVPCGKRHTHSTGFSIKKRPGTKPSEAHRRATKRLYCPDLRTEI